MPPNVVLVVMDAARRDAFEPYGAAPGSTPAVAQLAARGAARPDVYATAPWTVPSHASFFTGLLPRAAGLSEVPSPGAAKAALEPHRARFVSEVLRAHGYATTGVSANPWASSLSGFGTGFDEFRLLDNERSARIDGKGARAHLRWLAQAVRAQADDGGRAALRTLKERLGSTEGRPFFFFVNLLEAHFPYMPPRPYGDVSALGRLRGAEDARRYFTLESVYRINAGVLEIPDRALALARRLYAGGIRYMDDWLARLLEHLDSAGRLDDTLVIVTADHGENFGEGGLLAHMLSLDQRLIHVPFVAAGPGAEQLDLTSLAELPRCLAAAVGLDDHPWHDGPPPGIALAQSDGLGDPGDPSVAARLDAVGVAEERRERITDSLSCAVRGDLKLVRRRGGQEELYDLSADPLELDPQRPDRVAAERAGEVAELRRALDHPAMAVAEPPADGAGVAAEASAEEMADLEQRMKLLGYM